MERKQLRERPPEGGAYFDTAPPRFLTSGCAVLDCALGGGWACNRIINIVGDKSTGKTLLAIEAFANFIRAFPEGRVYYAESEAAFDAYYAESLGISLRDIIYFKCHTVQSLIEHMKAVCEAKKRVPGLYVIDSLDGLTTDEELEREVREGSYNTDKPRHVGKLFRMLTAELNTDNITFMIISQIRDNIGAIWGNKHIRSGGKALDFFASQVVWLDHKKQLKATRKGVERVVGVEIQAKVRKNKVGLPFRECTFPIQFGYGIDDAEAALDFLKEIGGIDKAGNIPALDTTLKEVRDVLKNGDDAAHAKMRRRLSRAVKTAWNIIEENFKVSRKKYG